MPHANRDVAIAGVGYSTVGRNTGLSLEQLAADAALAALDDAGLARSDVDGISLFTPLSQPLRSTDIAGMLGIPELRYFSSAYDGPAYIVAAINAICAIAAGICDTCLTIRSVQRAGSAQQTRPYDPGGVTGVNQFLYPAGAIGAVHWAAMIKQRHARLFGTTEEQFGAFAIAQRAFAADNDDALLRDPMSMDDYLASRFVSAPLRLLDCDYPVDAGSAIIFTTAERAGDLRQRPVLVDSYALHGGAVADPYILSELTQGAPFVAARQLWSRTTLGPGDVDVAGLYDGFTVIAMQWLEALGLCGLGESGAYVESGATGPGGRLPVNTDGGACNAGRRHGANYFIEVTRQLRGQSGTRQVPDAEAGVVTNGFHNAGCVLLTR
jgi:acetyl-CoA acetyltransferase